MKTRFHKNAKVADILITAIGGKLSVGMTLYGIFHFGLSETWPELVLNIFYIIFKSGTAVMDSKKIFFRYFIKHK